MKDLVNSPVKKYQDIFDTITNSNTINNSNTNYNKYLPTSDLDTDYTDIDLLPTENSNSNSLGTDMKDELKSFLKKQLNTSVDGVGSNFGSAF
jgi:hypothetical protein